MQNGNSQFKLEYPLFGSRALGTRMAAGKLEFVQQRSDGSFAVLAPGFTFIDLLSKNQKERWAVYSGWISGGEIQWLRVYWTLPRILTHLGKQVLERKLSKIDALRLAVELWGEDLCAPEVAWQRVFELHEAGIITSAEFKAYEEKIIRQTPTAAREPQTSIVS